MCYFSSVPTFTAAAAVEDIHFISSSVTENFKITITNMSNNYVDLFTFL